MIFQGLKIIRIERTIDTNIRCGSIVSHHRFLIEMKELKRREKRRRKRKEYRVRTGDWDKKKNDDAYIKYMHMSILIDHHLLSMHFFSDLFVDRYFVWFFFFIVFLPFSQQQRTYLARLQVYRMKVQIRSKKQKKIHRINEEKRYWENVWSEEEEQNMLVDDRISFPSFLPDQR